MIYGIKHTIIEEDEKPQVDKDHDYFTNLDEAINELKDCHNRWKKYYYKLIGDEFREDGVKSISELHFDAFKAHFESQEDLNNGIAIRYCRDVDQKKTTIKHELFESKEDPQITAAAEEVKKFLNCTLDKTKYAYDSKVTAYAHSGIGSHAHPAYEINIFPADEERHNSYGNWVYSIIIYKVGKFEDVFIKLMSRSYRSVPLVRSIMKESTTWYERCPQVHSNYTFCQEQLDKIHEIFMKKLK